MIGSTSTGTGQAPTYRLRALGAALLLPGLAGCVELGVAPPHAPTPAAEAPLVRMPSFAPIVDRVLPAVVNVAAVLPSGAADPEGEPGTDAPPNGLDELLRRFFALPPTPQPQQRQGISLGSGFIIDAAGYVVTANHVVANATEIAVVLHDDTRLPARLVGHDTLTDLALLKVEAGHPLPSVAWGDSNAVQVGDWVVAVGNPFGLGGTISSGILSARKRDLNSGPYDDFLQIDASINRGNSGGPTFDLSGGVIGITTAIYSPSGGSVGIAFAIPSSQARRVIEQLRSEGRIRHGWLGVRIQEVTPEIARSLGLHAAAGALTADIAADSPAAKAGLQTGDVILAYDGKPVHTPRELALAVAESLPGRKATLTIWRDRRESSLAVTIAELAEEAPPSPERRPESPHAEAASTVLGLALTPLTPEARQLFRLPAKLAGALVLSIAPDSPFSDTDIEPGDVITAIDRVPVTTPQQAVNRLGAAAKRHTGAVLLQLNRGGVNRFTALPLDGKGAQRE